MSLARLYWWRGFVAMKVHIKDTRAIRQLKPCMRANPDKGDIGHARNAATKFISIFALYWDSEGPSWTKKPHRPACRTQHASTNSQVPGPLSTCRWEAAFFGNSVAYRICWKRRNCHKIACFFCLTVVCIKVLCLSFLTCREMKVIMERATDWKMEKKGSWIRHTKSPGVPRKSRRLRQAPIRLTRAT